MNGSADGPGHRFRYGRNGGAPVVSRASIGRRQAGAAVLWWSFVDSRHHRVAHWWLVPVGTASVGICVAMPLYLLLRELAVQPE